jgi:anti-sigma-K factor RskA
MIDERKEELASSYVLGDLAPEDRGDCDQLLRTDSEFRSPVAELAEACSGLATTVEPAAPSAGLRRRVLQALPERSNSANVVSFPAASRPSALATALPWAMAAMLAIAFLTTLNSYMRQRDRAAVLASEVELFRTEATDLRQGYATLQEQNRLARLQMASLASQLDTTRAALAVAVWDGQSQEGLLWIESLPPLPESQDYQIWVVDPRYENPVNGGVFNPTTASAQKIPFTTDQPIEQVVAFAVSLERRGGVPKAEGPMVLVGKADQ